MGRKDEGKALHWDVGVGAGKDKLLGGLSGRNSRITFLILIFRESDNIFLFL
jgi:hypothetical protein